MVIKNIIMKGGVDVKLKPTTGSIIRTVTLVFALTNKVLTVAGINPLPFSDEEMYMFGTTAATLVTGVWAWWGNNSFTKEAIKADKYLKKLKSGEECITKEV